MYSIENAIKGLNFLATFKTKKDFPKGFTPKAEQYVDTVCKSFPYWSQANKEEFKALVKVIDKTHPALFERLRNDLKALVGVTTLKDVAKTTKNPEILAELIKLSEGMKALKEDLAKLFAERAKEIEAPKPKKKAKAVVVAGEEELFPL